MVVLGDGPCIASLSNGTEILLCLFFMIVATAHNLTIAIPVLNEENNIAMCLQAIGCDFAESVVVIDSGSVDNTCAIARRFGANVVDFKWDGRFPKKRNWFLRHHTPTTEWVMFLDADEILNPSVKQEISVALQGSSHQLAEVRVE